MKVFAYTARFTTPAFLGNAEQSGQWRTPPFKALLRQWWRVAYAAEIKFAVDLKAMRVAEGRLFGHASLEPEKKPNGEKIAARKSLLRLRLERWDEGQARIFKQVNAFIIALAQKLVRIPE